MNKKTLVYLKASFGLIIMIVPMILNWQWFWPVVFLVMVVQSIRERMVFFTDVITQEEYPFLFWVIILAYTILPLLSLAYIYFPSWFEPQIG